MTFEITVKWEDENLDMFEEKYEADTINFNSVLLEMISDEKGIIQIPTKFIKKCTIYPSDQKNMRS